jgi:hypothetical protein
MDVKETGWGMKCIYLAQDWGEWRDIVKAVMNLWVKQNTEFLG